MPSLAQLALLAAVAAAAASSPVREALAADDACSGGAGAGCAFHALQHQQRWEVDVAGDTELRAIVPVPARDEPRRSAKEEEKRRLEQPREELAMLTVQEESQRRSNGTCNTWTGGTCLTSGCAASRGATECSTYRCMCQKGFCANSQGACVFDFQEAASQFGFGFAQTMAEIAAKEQQPEQPKAELELASLASEETQHKSNSTCSSWTGGTCMTSGCAASRGATECSMYRCVCQKGFCANSQGSCVFDLQEAASQFGFGFAQTMAEIAAKEQQQPEQPKAELELAELAAKETQSKSNSTCSSWTGGTCMTSGCAASRGATECSMYRCVCQKGFCANSQGSCVFDLQEAASQFGFGFAQTMAEIAAKEQQPEQPKAELELAELAAKETQSRSNGTCSSWTGGTCMTSGCAASRGATECSMYRCVCQKGFCANSQGACVFDLQEAASQFGFGFAQTMAEIAAKEQQPEQPKAELELAELAVEESQHRSNGTCNTWTGGTCLTSGCAASRGATECSTYRCVCQKGFCANSQGACVFDLQEAASQFGFGFAQSMAEIAAKERRPERPKTEPELASLAVEETQHRSNGTCNTWTGGTCLTSGCAASRGATECSTYRCMCQKGFCANSQGACVFDFQEAASQFGFGFAQTMAEIAAKEQQPEQPKAELELAELTVEEKQSRSNSTCSSWTGGTCMTSGCAASRGATECSMYRCVCQKGFCANSQGSCVFDLQEAASQFGFGFAQTMAEIAAKEQQRPERPKAELELAELTAKESQHRSNSTCNTWTGGTCLTSGCAASRGATECSTYRCVCQKGFCANSQGACAFDFQEAAAQFGFGAPHRALIQTMAKAGVEERYLEGPRAELAKLSAEELHSKLVVRERSADEEAQNRSSSSCSTWTGGTCVTSGCGASRGATECSMYRCVCRSGFCANSQGVCVFDFQSAASSYGWGAAPAPAPDYFGWGAPAPAPAPYFGWGAPAPSPWAGAWAAPSGNPSTGGSCMFSSCAASRGPTDCSITTGYQCMCKSNFHAVNGVCVWR